MKDITGLERTEATLVQLRGLLSTPLCLIGNKSRADIDLLGEIGETTHKFEPLPDGDRERRLLARRTQEASPWRSALFRL